MAKPIILIVEDDPKIVTIFSKAAIHAEYEVEAIQRGDLAIKRLEKDPTPNVIILDMHLPYYSGEQILERIRQNNRFEHTKIIIASADLYMTRGLDDQADYILNKPVAYTKIRNLLRELQGLAPVD